MKPLDSKQQEWVNETLASLSLEERVAQLLIPQCDSPGRFQYLLHLMPSIPVGSVFVSGAPAEELRDRIGQLQKAGRVPLVVAADLECGAGHIVQGATAFPEPLALAAADDAELAYQMGKAAAQEGRAVGIHWTYAPVVDVNINPDNPIANTRSLGDDPRRITRLATAIIRGLQENGMAACPKHFPGDGVDDIDQHISTSVNSLSLEQWLSVSGHAFRTAYAADAWSTMIGHIALPAWDSATDSRGSYSPATVNPRIVTGLLREKLGFDGLIVTDDMNMGGVAGYMNRKERTVACINAGCDMLLFPKLPDDYQTLLEATASGALSKQRIDQAARRVLTFKARLRLHEEVLGRAPADEDRVKFSSASRAIAERAIVCVRNTRLLLPLKELKRGAEVLTITLATDAFELPEVDKELAVRGYHVTHVRNPDDWHLWEKLGKYEAIFVNFACKASWGVGSARPVGTFNRIFIGGFYMDHPRVVFTSFGSPYLLRWYRTLPNYVNAHSSSSESQRAAVAGWFGEIPMTGSSPVSNLTLESEKVALRDERIASGKHQFDVFVAK
jgi:beta-N-acetylhexosaminidase